MSLQGKVALVTGASRGIGRGIALQLGGNGAKVYITGRKPEQSLATQYTSLPSLEKTAKEIESRGGQAVVVYTDHADMSQVKTLFQQIDSENHGNLDILVNNAFAGGKALTSNGEKLFFEEEPEVWDIINNVGLRNHYYCCVYASRIMTKRQPSHGLIVNISSLGGLRYFMSVPYGVGKQAIDRMSADMGLELAPFKVTVLSLWPGAVKTELTSTLIEKNELNIKKSKDISENATKIIMANGESIEFPGKAIVALASDPNVHQRYNGRCVLTADLGLSYGFKDIDGRQILSPRSVNYAFANEIVRFPGSRTLANFVPNIREEGGLWSLYFSTTVEPRFYDFQGTVKKRRKIKVRLYVDEICKDSLKDGRVLTAYQQFIGEITPETFDYLSKKGYFTLKQVTMNGRMSAILKPVYFMGTWIQKKLLFDY